MFWLLGFAYFHLIPCVCVCVCVCLSLDSEVCICGICYVIWSRVMSSVSFFHCCFSVRVNVSWILGNVNSRSLFLIDLDVVNIHKTEHISYFEAIRTI